MSTGNAAELAALFPAPRTVTIAGRDVEIKRCGIAQGGRIIDAGAGLYQRIVDGAEFLSLFEEFPDETTTLIVAATDLPRDWVAALDPVDQFALASEWMEVNAGFFARRLLPSLARYMGALGAMNGDGATPSTPLSAPDTSTPATTPLKPQASISQPSLAPKGAIGVPA